MFFAILGTAQWSLSIISDIPTPPSPVPQCVKNAVANLDPLYDRYGNSHYLIGYSLYGSYSRYSYRTDYPDCTEALVSENPKFDFQADYAAIREDSEKISNAQSRIDSLRSDISTAEYRKNSSRTNYRDSLSEKTAGESGNGLYDPDKERSNIRSADLEIDGYKAEITKFEQEIANIRNLRAPDLTLIKDRIANAERAYATAANVYSLAIALLHLLFSGLVFFVLYRLYVQWKTKNSPHTIIASVATFAYGLILLQVLFVFLWSVIPHRLAKLLMELLSLFAPLMFLVQFLWPVVIVGVFGFLVYRIQKRLYSPQNRLKRFLSSEQCPNCGNSVDVSKPFCPLCAHEIQIRCPSCHELTVKGMPHCSGCGIALEKDGPAE